VNNNLFWAIIATYFIVTFIAMIWKIKKSYKNHQKKHQHYSNKVNYKLAIKDFLNSDGASNRSYMIILLPIIIFPFLISVIFFALILPATFLLLLCILFGIIVFIYFFRMIIDTSKSIKREKFKTTIKIKPMGVLSIFIFLIFVCAYLTKIEH